MIKTVWEQVLAEPISNNLQTAGSAMELSGARALVLTGNPAWADTIGPLLRHEGMAPEFASSFQLFDQMKATIGKFDLIIMDVASGHWPNMELCRQIRKQHSLLQLPILIITGRKYPTSPVDAFAAGGNDTLLAPFDEAELRARVRQLLLIKSSASAFIRMEMAYLHTRIKPHFLFNTLNSIASLSEEDPVVMRMLLNRLGAFLYKSFREDNLEPLIPIHQELSLVETYLDIEKIRFGHRLRTQVVVDEEASHALIPPLSVQSLAENAVRHGLTARKQGGMLQVSVTAEEGKCRISVQDDGVGTAKAAAAWHKHGSNRGGSLSNIDRRLKQIYGTGLTIHSDPESGTRISFTIPLAGGYDHESHSD